MKLLVVGLGHAHLHVLTRAPEFARAGAELVLIDPGDFWYSGLATGLLSGSGRPEDDRIEAQRFAAACGVRFIKARARGLNPKKRQLFLESGETLDYDLVSFNTGSVVSTPFPVGGDGIWMAKPIEGLWSLSQWLEGLSDGRSLAVIGGGVTGCELMSNISARFGKRLALTLVARSDCLMDGWPEGAGRALQKLLTRRGVTLRLGSGVQSVTRRQVMLDGGDCISADAVLLATGLGASPLMGRLGLPFHEVHGLRVTSALHSVADEDVFAVGDCAEIAGHELPKIGVFGVRAAPVLADNLLARVKGGRLRQFHPQSVWFSALNLGDGTGLAKWGPVWWQGRSALWLKNRFDHGFMRRYQKIARNTHGPR